jgi:hypothetical protein
MDRETIDQIRENWKKERQEKLIKKVPITISIVVIVAARTIERELAKQHWTSFILTWSSTIVQKVGDIFHLNFKEGIKAHLDGYRGVNLSETTNARNHAQ